MTSIDPAPRQEIDRICDRIIRSPLESCDLGVFDELAPGDTLFFDGSHRAFSNSDVVVFFFEVLPRLRSGVIVHIHDIFIPDDYPAVWNQRLYNEQYILAAMLMCEKPPFRVVAPVAFICQDEALSASAKRAFISPTGGRDIPFMQTSSFWLEVEALGDYSRG
jgi:methyltransferase family protein